MPKRSRNKTQCGNCCIHTGSERAFPDISANAQRNDQPCHDRHQPGRVVVRDRDHDFATPAAERPAAVPFRHRRRSPGGLWSGTLSEAKDRAIKVLCTFSSRRNLIVLSMACLEGTRVMSHRKYLSSLTGALLLFAQFSGPASAA